MGERKVLNKYYPPDFDPAKVPRRKMAKDRQYKVRLMAPFNMRLVAPLHLPPSPRSFGCRSSWGVGIMSRSCSACLPWLSELPANCHNPVSMKHKFERCCFRRASSRDDHDDEDHQQESCLTLSIHWFRTAPV